MDILALIAFSAVDLFSTDLYPYIFPTASIKAESLNFIFKVYANSEIFSS